MKSARILPNAHSGASAARKRRTRQGNGDHVYRVIEIVGTSEKAFQTQSTARSRAPTRRCAICDGSKWTASVATSRVARRATIR